MSPSDVVSNCRRACVATDAVMVGGVGEWWPTKFVSGSRGGLGLAPQSLGVECSRETRYVRRMAAQSGVYRTTSFRLNDTFLSNVAHNVGPRRDHNDLGLNSVSRRDIPKHLNDAAVRHLAKHSGHLLERVLRLSPLSQMHIICGY